MYVILDYAILGIVLFNLRENYLTSSSIYKNKADCVLLSEKILKEKIWEKQMKRNLTLKTQR